MTRTRPSPSSSYLDQRAGLFAAVKQAPDDDTPRLILADWLEEYGDDEDRAHAELIRVQCEILCRSARIINPDNPGPIHGLLRAAGYHTSVLPCHFAPLTDQDECIFILRQREKKLLESFDGRSLTGLSSRAICTWQRGFAFLNLMDDPFRSREMAAFAASRAGMRIEALSVTATSSSSARIARNPLLAHAVGLEVRGPHRDPASLTSLLASSHLAGLRRFERLFAADTVSALEQAPQRERLTHLYLPSSTLAPNDLRTFARVGWPALRVLHLGGTIEMGSNGARALAGGAFLAHLQELSLTHCRLGSKGMEALAGSSAYFRCPELLKVGSNNIGPAGLRALLDAPGLERLVVLEADRNALDDAAIAALAGSPRLAGLLRLDINENSAVGPAGAEALASSPHLRRLASLDMKGCSIGEAGARALLRSPHLRRLSLAIDQTGVSAGTLAALEERFVLKKR